MEQKSKFYICEFCGTRRPVKVRTPRCSYECQKERKKKKFNAPLTARELEILMRMKRDQWSWPMLKKEFGVSDHDLTELGKRADAQLSMAQILELYGVKSETLHNP